MDVRLNTGCLHINTHKHTYLFLCMVQEPVSLNYSVSEIRGYSTNCRNFEEILFLIKKRNLIPLN